MLVDRKHLTSALTILMSALVGGLPAQGMVTRYRVGNPVDAKPVLCGPAFNLGGGGKDVMAALQWMINQVRGSNPDTRLDVVVLRATQADGYNNVILALDGVNSVETLVITSPADANAPDVEATLRQAEVVFFAGGNQCHYVTNFKGSKVEEAIKALVARGGAVGGTSAGCAIMGSKVFDACQINPRADFTSAQALSDPYNPQISFSNGFFTWAPLSQVITDTHFVPRERMGRTMSFLARLNQDAPGQKHLGIAVNEKTSLVIDKAGLGQVMGEGPVFMVLADHPPEACLPGQPLTYTDFKIWRLEPGMTFDLAHRPEAGYYTRSVVKGVLSADPYRRGPLPAIHP